MRLHQPVAHQQQPHLQRFFGGGIPANGEASPNSIAVSSGSYDDGGVVNPNAYLGWPNENPGFAGGGQVDEGQIDPDSMLDPSGVNDPTLADIVGQNMQDYHDYHKGLEQVWREQNGGQTDEAQGGQGFAHGGGVPPGPAGPGITPHSPKGNPGRPNWTDPNSKAPAEKNFAQNVTSRGFTSPSVGTAYMQPGPAGGQRGQEDYGKKSTRRK